MRLSISGSKILWNNNKLKMEKVKEEKYKEICSGTLYITSKRIIHFDNLKFRSIPLKKIDNINRYTDGIEIIKNAGRNVFLNIVENQDMFLFLLKRVLFDISK